MTKSLHKKSREAGLLLLASGAVALLLSTGCNSLQGPYSYPPVNILSMKTYRAEDFFTKPQLAIAQSIESGDTDQLRKLALGVDLSAIGQHDMTLMWFAILRHNYVAVQTLVSLGVNPDKQTAPGVGSALYFAMTGRTDPNDPSGTLLLKAMLDGGLSPNYKPPDDGPLIQRAARASGSLAAVQLLVARGADVNARDDIGGTALYDAICDMRLDSALYLVEHGADLNAHTVNGITMTWAVYNEMQRQRPGPMLTKFEQLRDLMISKGAKWPPDPPAAVRDQMRVQKDIPPVVPAGQKR